MVEIRQFKIPRQPRPRKRCLKTEFAFFRSLSRLLQLMHLLRQMQANSSSSERERKFGRRLCTSSIKVMLP